VLGGYNTSQSIIVADMLTSLPVPEDETIKAKSDHSFPIKQFWFVHVVTLRALGI